MRKIERTRQFKRDYKRESKGQYSKVLDVALLDVLELILASKPLPAKTTGSMPLSEGVLQLLDSIQRSESCEHVFANPKTNKAYTNIFYSWNTARKSVGLGDVRIHDLRHSFASFLVNAGRSLYEVQKILGHTQISTTQRYAHLSQDTLLEAANVVYKAVPLLMSKPSVSAVSGGRLILSKFKADKK